MSARPVENLVIGGGLAGSMMAIRLAAAGQPVTLIERARHAHHKVCGEFLSPEAVAYLHQAGVDPLALGAAIIRIVRLTSNKKSAQAALPFRALSLSRRVLDEALLLRAAESGCTIRRGISVENLNQQGCLHSIRLSNGESFLARTVFLATGKHDLRGFARPAGKQSDLVGFKMHWQLAPAQTRALRDVIELFLFPGGYGGISLVENEIANLCLVVRRSRIRALGGWTELLASILRHNAAVRECLHGATPLWQRSAGHFTHSVWVSCRPDYTPLVHRRPGRCHSVLHRRWHGDRAPQRRTRRADAPRRRSSAEYHRELRNHLGNGMSGATVLSRLLVNGPGRGFAPHLLALFPSAMRWIAVSTRVPSHALVRIAPLANSTPAR